MDNTIETENITTYIISHHAQERYAARIMGKEDAGSINRFIAENKEKIQIDINKMINFGERIFCGKQSQKDGKGKVIDVYLNGTWIILVDTQKTKNVISLYKIDFGLDDDFNKQYIDKMIEKLNKAKEHLVSVQREVDEENNTYNEMTSDAEIQIKEYKTMIKNLEALRDAYQSIIHNNTVKVSQADREIADIVNTLISKKEF